MTTLLLLMFRNNLRGRSYIFVIVPICFLVFVSRVVFWRRPSTATTTTTTTTAQPVRHPNKLAAASASTVGVPSDFHTLSTLPRFLQDYIDFHAASDTTTTTTTTTTSSSSTKYLRWVCEGGCGGTGDRISGLLQTLYMAICTHRKLIVQWTHPDDLIEYLQPHWIEWNQTTPLPMSADFTIHAIDNKNDVYLNDPYQMPKSATLIDIYTNVWRKQETILATDCMQDYLKSYNNGTDVSSLSLYRLGFWTLFRFSHKVLDYNHKMRQQLQLSSPYIAIHLRTGRVTNVNDLILPTNQESTWPLYHHCAHAVQRRLQEHCSRTTVVPIYLAADTSDAKRAFLEYDSEIRTMPEMEIYHLDRTVATQLNNAELAELQVWNDIQLLLESTCLIMTRVSKFSRLGQWLSSQQPRCALYYDECNATVVEAAVTALNRNEVC